MAFTPPHCPFDSCAAHTVAPDAFRYRTGGTYRRKCDGRIVPRFYCDACKRGFSLQTFRLDYRLRRPELLPRVFLELVSKVTQRQSARSLVCHRTTVVRHFLRLAVHGRDFHAEKLALRRAEGGIHGAGYLLDELETYEQHRKLKPVTVPVLIERESGFVVAHAAEALASRRPNTEREQRQLAEIVAREGQRTCGSREGVARCFELLRRLDPRPSGIVIETDRKASYANVVSAHFGTAVQHWRHSSKLPRTTSNPLWPINHTLARLRDGLSRLVRETWAAAKLRARLQAHLCVWTLWRNYVRGRTNRHAHVTPAMKLGVCKERWSAGEVLVARIFPKRVAAV